MFKRNIRLLIVIGLLLSFTLTAMPSSAQQFPYFNWTAIDVDCSQPAFTGAQTSLGYLDYEYYLPHGHTMVGHWFEQWSDYYGGGSRSDSFVYTVPDGQAWTFSGSVGWFWVDWNGGYVEYEIDLYDPAGNLIVSADAYMTCDGDSMVHGGSIWDPMVPDPSIRREGTVVENTFVYGLPDPTTATDAVLTMGQMWFAIGQEEGSDGQIWYNVYISGGYGWVPSSAMVLNAPFSEEEPSGEPAAEPEEEKQPLVTNPVSLPTIGGGGARPSNP